MERSAYCTASCADAGANVDDIVRRYSHLVVAEAIVNLMDFFALCCFVMGWLCRNCHWDGRQLGSGKLARELLMVAIYCLRGCANEGVRKLEYYRSIVLTLASWTRWYDEVPGAVYSEEPCEAGLSRLSRLLNDHSQYKTVKEAMFLYLMVDPAKKGKHRVSGESVSDVFVQEVVTRFLAVVTATDVPVVNVPWKPGGRVLPDVWTTHTKFPGPCLKLDRSTIEEDVLLARRTLLAEQKLADEVVAELDATFDRQTDEVTRVRESALANWLTTHQPVGRLRRGSAGTSASDRHARGHHTVFDMAIPADGADARSGGVASSSAADTGLRGLVGVPEE